LSLRFPLHKQALLSSHSTKHKVSVSLNKSLKIAMNGREGEEGVKMEECKEIVVYMCGYIPGASPEKSPILSPVPVRLPGSIDGGDSRKDVCGGGCGFAMAISG
jgi:hypothetical protein